MMTKYVKREYPFSEVTSKIIAAAFEVHHHLGPGFKEIIYQRALELELFTHDLDSSREVWLAVHYKGKVVGRKRADFVVDGVMVEIKAKSQIEDVDYIQATSYLKASGFEIGLLINFGAKELEIKRLIHTPIEPDQ